ncbi:hypothetical protein [Vibrio coralliilyticus]|uniref:Uncharacterized protein n=1 Tax=Vibrio coralliilyticus TaxID=190893 RepID=A0AAP7DG23_9VIBR|nr:hypothetical protein [Vibrio coralliilyticus]NOI32009.1 hypothetical protein [Vibrio coralliilyticus]NOJ25210.1 hypothetical protein [Vibrio coralliilyticus]
MSNERLDSYAKNFISLGMASDYDGSIESLIPAIVIYSDAHSLIEIAVGSLAMRMFARCVIKHLKVSFIYRIYADYDYGDQSVYIESFLPLEDMRDVCRYICLKGEQILTKELGEECLSPNNFAVAAILISHFHCAASIREDDATEIELYRTLDGSGTFETADSRYEQWVPENADSFMQTLRLFVASTNGLDNTNCHYAKYKQQKP